MNTCHILHNIRVHLINIFVCARHIVCGIILHLIRLAHPRNIHLNVSLITGNHALTLYVIERIKIVNAIVEFPDLGIRSSCLILQCQGIIRLPRLRLQNIFLLAQIDSYKLFSLAIIL